MSFSKLFDLLRTNFSEEFGSAVKDEVKSAVEAKSIEHRDMFKPCPPMSKKELIEGITVQRAVYRQERLAKLVLSIPEDKFDMRVYISAWSDDATRSSESIRDSDSGVGQEMNLCNTEGCIYGWATTIMPEAVMVGGNPAFFNITGLDIPRATNRDHFYKVTHPKLDNRILTCEIPMGIIVGTVLGLTENDANELVTNTGMGRNRVRAAEEIRKFIPLTLEAAEKGEYRPANLSRYIASPDRTEVTPVPFVAEPEETATTTTESEAAPY